MILFPYATHVDLSRLSQALVLMQQDWTERARMQVDLDSFEMLCDMRGERE